MKYLISFLVLIFIILNTTAIVMAKQPRAKFYDFNEQLIDGEIKKPITLYTDARS